MYNMIGVELCFSLVLFVWFLIMFIFMVYLSLNNVCILFSWEMMNCVSSFLEMEFVMDWMSCSFSALVCFISSCVMIFSKSYMEGDKYTYRFILLLFLFVLSMNFLVFIPNLVSLLLGWDGLGLVSFCLVIYYQNNKSLSAGMLTVLMNRVGDCFILGGISMMIVLGHWNMLCIWDFHNFLIVNMFIMISGMTKSAQIPFSSWLPAAMAAPTPVSALVHSSTLVTAGVYLFIRFFIYLKDYYWFSGFMLYISIMTTIMSGICALFEYDMKKIIALSTLSQLGVMMMSLSINMPMLALFHLYTHAMFKALLFLCGGNIINMFEGKQDLRQISNVFNLMPITSMFLIVSKMALCGLPFLAGFYSKDLIIESLIIGNMNMILFFLGLFGLCLTVMYSVRFCFFVLWKSEELSTFNYINDNNYWSIMSMSLLVIGALWGGYVFQEMFCLFNQDFLMPMFMKLYTLFLVLISIIISLGLWDKSFILFNKGMLKYINSSMWFLSSFICFSSIKGFVKISNSSLKTIDMGWFEILGGQGLFNMNNLIFNILERWMIVMFNCYVIIFVLMWLFFGI
uniref:NADH-ubiquinone oxidoreductase chain 5 n=2 Tax=Sepia latimanus TaxID=3248881 RepID=T2HRL9_SEPLA|nr:NADH dehydrogenase subunit 5 [Sepia latimanus]BAN81953.1 NADH dehydrogenase subunit 5 [Sepia latimanus]